MPRSISRGGGAPPARRKPADEEQQVKALQLFRGGTEVNPRQRELVLSPTTKARFVIGDNNNGGKSAGAGGKGVSAIAEKPDNLNVARFLRSSDVYTYDLYSITYSII
jgi:hypothetical protein